MKKIPVMYDRYQVWLCFVLMMLALVGYHYLIAWKYHQFVREVKAEQKEYRMRLVNELVQALAQQQAQVREIQRVVIDKKFVQVYTDHMVDIIEVEKEYEQQECGGLRRDSKPCIDPKATKHRAAAWKERVVVKASQ